MYNILITSVGGTLAPFLINKIKNGKFKDLKITGTNQSNKCIAKYFLDNFVVTPSGNSTKYIDHMKKIVKKFNIDLLIPGSDEEALNLSKNKKYFIQSENGKFYLKKGEYKLEIGKVSEGFEIK